MRWWWLFVSIAVLGGAATPSAAAQVPPATFPLIDSVLTLEDAAEFATLTHILRPLRYDTPALHYMRMQARELDNCAAESFANNYLGKIERNASRFERALEYHDLALVAAKRCGDTVLLAAAHNGRGVVFRRQDQIAGAVEAHEAARAVARAVHEKSDEIVFELGVAINSLGNIYLATEQWTDAEREFRESMRLQRPLGNDLGMAINYHNLGYALEQQGMLDTAMRYYERSLSYNEKIDSDIGRALCHTSMADLQLDIGNTGEALPLARLAVEYAQRENDAFYIASALTVLGRALTAAGALDEARDPLMRGLSVADDKGFTYERGRAHQSLAKLDSLSGDYLSALRHFNEGAAAERELLSDVNRRIVGSLSAKLETERQAAKIEKLAQDYELVRERAQRDRLLLTTFVIGAAFLGGLALVLYRQRRIVEDRDRAQLERSRLASQMNPHFLFNALNSIKAFLIDNDREAAISYLSTFAKLVRRILNSSINDTVTLGEELENSQLYVRIENARLQDEIDFELKVDDEVSLSAIRIPPLTLQPFLENAVWHGLQASDGEKHLQLLVSQRGKHGVRIRIVDNGVGREAAAKARATRVLKRASVGIDLTRQRLDHYASARSTKAEFKTLDLIAPDGEAMGTEVVLDIGG